MRIHRLFVHLSLTSLISLIISLIISVTASQAWSATLSPNRPYYPESFYQSIEDGASDRQLLTQLFDILSKAHITGTQNDTLTNSCSRGTSCYQHVSLGYERARTILFGEIHLVNTDKGYGILDVYCQQLSTENEYQRQPPGPGRIPDNNKMNTEHTWPQSRFSRSFPDHLQKSDLHILYPVLPHANSTRSNLEYGEVVTPTSSPCPIANRGFTSIGGRQQYFEVPELHKGNAARAVFYFSARYRLPISAEEESTLRSWNRMDPPDEFERRRNELIFNAQKDRNPFIDYPELVDLISDF